MNIILVPQTPGKSRQFNIKLWHFGAALAVWLAVPPVLAYVGFTYVASDVRRLDGIGLGWVGEKWVQNRARAEEESSQASLNAMAVRVGEMQAQLTRLDALGERVAKAAGISAREFGFGKPPGQGGPEPTRFGDPNTLRDISHEIDRLSHEITQRQDQLVVLEGVMLQDRARTPSAIPVASGWVSSGFGWRFDPFNGSRTMHEGVDFPSPVGTTVMAAGSGVVLSAGTMTGYGNVLEVDHGDGVVSRYAHLSRILVKEGDVVLKGQKVAEVGNTGRSTGAHLHFEVRLNGEPVDPTRYLAQLR